MERVPSLVEALDAYDLAWRSAGRSAESCRSRRSQLHPLRALGDLRLHDLDTVLCRSLILQRFDRVAHNSVRTFAVALAAFCSFCVHEGWFSTSPMQGVEKPGAHVKPQRIYAPAQLRAMMAAGRDDYDRAALALAAGSGLRASEITGLLWERVDLATGCVWVRGKGRNGGKWRALDASGAMPFLERLPRIGEEVFPFVYEALRTRLQRMAVAAGIGHVKVHELRHTFSVLFLEASEEDGFTLQQLLGHTSPDMTARYVQTVRERAAVRKMRRVNLSGRLFDDDGSDV